MKVKVFCVLIVALSFSTSVWASVENISNIFKRYLNLDKRITKNIFNLRNEKYKDIDILRYICDQHKTFLSENKFDSEPVLHNKIRSNEKWINFENVSTEIRIHYEYFLQIIESCDTLDFKDSTLKKLFNSISKQEIVFFKSIRSTMGLLYYSSNETINNECTLTTESMNWESLYHKIETTFLQAYILTKFELLATIIKTKVDSLLLAEYLRVAIRNGEKIIFQNFLNQVMHREDESITRCIAYNTITPKSFHLFNRQVYVSLREAASDIEHNMIVVGFRFLKQPNQNVIHLQIRQAKVSVAGSIISGSDHWKPVNFLSILHSKENIDYFKVKEPCLLIPTDIRRELPFIVTGLKLSKISDNIVLMARFNELDIEQGTVNGSITDHWQFEFGSEKRLFKCAYNYSSLILDMQPIFSEPLMPLSGVGIYKLRDNLIVSPKLFPKSMIV